TCRCTRPSDSDAPEAPHPSSATQGYGGAEGSLALRVAAAAGKLPQRQTDPPAVATLSLSNGRYCFLDAAPRGPDGGRDGPRQDGPGYSRFAAAFPGRAHSPRLARLSQTADQQLVP